MFWSDPGKHKESEIWIQIEKIWNDFNKGLVEFEDWEREENLEGLVTDISPETLLKYVYSLKGHEMWSFFPPEIQTYLVAAFLAGIRVGNKLHEERNKE